MANGNDYSKSDYERFDDIQIDAALQKARADEAERFGWEHGLIEQWNAWGCNCLPCRVHNVKPENNTVCEVYLNWKKREDENEAKTTDGSEDRK